MVLTASTMLELGAQAPPFSLPDTTGKTVCLDDFKNAAGLLVVFLCNHCPYVKHVQYELATIGREYGAKGVAMVSINANDAVTYPDDSFARMGDEARRIGYSFPYLYDESQEVAKAYQAACTPDFFLFDREQRLVYRGQLDDARPGKTTTVTGRDLRRALDALLAGQPISKEQQPSMGCNIKWKTGNAPKYFLGG
ncbi:thioredoxin family protein [uncultured Desulfobulbus sp.]|uniref:thioredoxin family protein n=1 Tax=uncultured Desulfobulbus sp. TaxID=239745 RepID=UPI0029C66810|nr:thioredoxin family protein [uncultured Desulfobulbus sp.]